MLFSFRMADDGSVAVCEYSRSPSQFYYYVVPLYASVSACSVLLLMMMMMILSIYLSSLVGITRQMCTYQIIFPTSKTRRVLHGVLIHYSVQNTNRNPSWHAYHIALNVHLSKHEIFKAVMILLRTMNIQSYLVKIFNTRVLKLCVPRHCTPAFIVYVCVYLHRYMSAFRIVCVCV